jgi:hypothetical protein
MAAEHLEDVELFYHPQCFVALAALLAGLPALAEAPRQDVVSLLCEDRVNRGQTTLSLPPALAKQADAALNKLGIAAALDHCRRQAKSSVQFQRHFHGWFDGFRTLKFIHALRDAGWPTCSLRELNALTPPLWPQLQAQRLPQQEQQSSPTVADHPHEVEQLRRSIRQHWGWQ